MSRPIWMARRRKNEVYVKNGSFENLPIFTGETAAAGYWINGQSGGDIRDNRYGWWMQGAGGSCKFDSATFYVGGSAMCLYQKVFNTDTVVQNYPGGSNIKGYGAVLKPSTAYYCTFMMKTLYLDGSTQTGQGAALQTIIRDSSGSLKGGITIAGQNISTSSTTFITATTDWTMYSGTFTTPAVDTVNGYEYYFTPKLCIFNTTGTAKDLLMKAWFDDIRLYEVV